MPILVVSKGERPFNVKKKYKKSLPWKVRLKRIGSSLYNCLVLTRWVNKLKMVKDPQRRVSLNEEGL